MFSIFEIDSVSDDPLSLLADCDGKFTVPLPDIALPSLDLADFTSPCQGAYVDYFRDTIDDAALLRTLEIAATSIRCEMSFEAVQAFFLSKLPSDLCFFQADSADFTMVYLSSYSIRDAKTH